MKRKKVTSLILSIAMSMVMFTGCGGSDSSSTSTSSTSTASTSESTASSESDESTQLEHMDISVAIWGIQEGFDNSNAENDTIFNDLEERFNVTINPVGVTWNDYQEKNKVWAASGSLPDIFADNLVTDNNALYKTWASQGIIKEIPQDLSAYPNLEAVMSATTVQALAIDGKQYMIPRGGNMTSASAGAGMAGMSRAVMYRKDWAEEAGYTKTPTSFDEMVEMIKAMMANHPEASGIVANNSDYLATLSLDIMPEYANTSSWVYENDQWIPCYASERVIPYLERMQKLYADGILDPDFITQKDGDAIAKFMSGYACVSLGGEFNAVTFMEANQDVENLEDALGFILPFASEDGNTYVFTSTPYWSETYINADVDDEKLDRILMILDYMYSEEYVSLVMNGIEGVDWEEQDGEKVSLLSEDESLSDKYPITSSLGYLASWSYGDGVISSNPSTAAYTRLHSEVKYYELENMSAAPINFSVMLMNNEEKTTISNLSSDFIDKANNIIISGNDARTEWEKVIEEFNGKGLQEAITSVTAQASEEGILP
jgi:putative aldouronate transport system substrate-binding protein